VINDDGSRTEVALNGDERTTLLGDAAGRQNPVLGQIIKL